MSAVAKALGGNRNTMRDLFGQQPLIYERPKGLGKDEEEDEEEKQAALEIAEEGDFGLGEFEHNGNFSLDQLLLKNITLANS
jgi:hypothetical protein